MTLSTPIPLNDVAAAGIQPSVLVVDDERCIREFLTSLLEDEGYRVHQASNARDAFSLAQMLSPDLVISDVMMPNGTGLDLYAQLSGLDHCPPVIFMSAASGRTVVPFAPFLEKPFDIEDLLHLISGHVGNLAVSQAIR